MKKKKWDVFISHASEDKDDIVDKLVILLEYFNIKTWYDKDILSIGDNLSKSIDIGLSESKYGVIILSENFIKKGWTEYEFRSLLNREIGKRKVILPIWHGIKKETIEKYSPFLLEKYALETSKQTIEQISIELIKVIKPKVYKNIHREILWRKIKSNAKIENVNLSQLKVTGVKHNTLPKDLMLRIANLYYSIFCVLGFDFDKMVYDFKCDLHPHDEVAVWEFIYLCFQEYSNITGDYDNKKNILKQLLLFSVGNFEKFDGISDNELLNLLMIWKNNFPLYFDK